MNSYEWFLVVVIPLIIGGVSFCYGYIAGKNNAVNDEDLHAMWMNDESSRRVRELRDSGRTYPPRYDAGPPARISRANVKGRERRG